MAKEKTETQHNGVCEKSKSATSCVKLHAIYSFLKGEIIGVIAMHFVIMKQLLRGIEAWKTWARKYNIYNPLGFEGEIMRLNDVLHTVNARTMNVGNSTQEDAKKAPCVKRTKKETGETRLNGRFQLAYDDQTGLVRIQDTMRKKLKPYCLDVNKNAWGIIDRLLKNYATGTEQVIRSDSQKWKGAFQLRKDCRNDAWRFSEEQIFKLPRWDARLGRYQARQFSGRWRLFTDAEIRLPKEKRIKKYIENHPTGCL